MIRRWWRIYGPKVVAWAFSKFITIVRLRPGDILVVYDKQLLDQLTHTRNLRFPFQVPLINAQSCEGEEILLFKQMNFKELTSIYQIAARAYREAECERIQDSVSNS